MLSSSLKGRLRQLKAMAPLLPQPLRESPSDIFAEPGDHAALGPRWRSEQFS